MILYRVLFGTVGMASYWPYLGVTFALHIVVAWIVYVRRPAQASPAWALGAMAVVLMLGSGGDDILWAFQSGTIGAVAAGHGRGRRGAAPTGRRGHPADGRDAHVGRVAGVPGRDGGPPVLTRPRGLVWLALPVGLYLVWYVLFATSAISPGLDGLVEYVLDRAVRERGRGAGIDRAGRR